MQYFFFSFPIRFSFFFPFQKRLWEEMNKVKPDPLERDKERALQRIAQRFEYL